MFKLYIGVAASAAVAAVLLLSVFNPLTTHAGPPGVGVNNHVDTRFDWQSKEFGDIHLYWYEGSLTDNPNIESFLVDWYIRDAWTAMWKTQILLDVRLPHPLHIYMYKDWDDIRVFRNSSDSQHIVGFTVDREHRARAGRPRRCTGVGRHPPRDRPPRDVRGPLVQQGRRVQVRTPVAP